MIFLALFKKKHSSLPKTPEPMSQTVGSTLQTDGSMLWAGKAGNHRSGATILAHFTLQCSCLSAFLLTFALA
ncbi:MAG: hypothetical protein J6I32_06175 [Bacteroidaceae bacterium]|nr:hypothetical protein [Bacteroidaceae bacterium]